MLSLGVFLEARALNLVVLFLVAPAIGCVSEGLTVIFNGTPKSKERKPVVDGHARAGATRAPVLLGYVPFNQQLVPIACSSSRVWTGPRPTCLDGLDTTELLAVPGSVPISGRKREGDTVFIIPEGTPTLAVWPPDSDLHIAWVSETPPTLSPREDAALKSAVLRDGRATKSIEIRRGIDTDIDGDGRTERLIHATVPQQFQVQCALASISTDQMSEAQASILLWSVCEPSDALLATADLEGDGHKELIMRGPALSAPAVFTYTGSRYQMIH